MRVNILCRNCGTFNQMELVYNVDGYYGHCLLCSREVKLKIKNPQVLNQRQYEDSTLQSPQDCHFLYGTFGSAPTRRLRRYEE